MIEVSENVPLIELEIQEVFEGSGGNPSREYDYEKLKNKPSINGVELIGDKTLEEIGIGEISNSEIEEIIKSIGGL